MTGRRGSISSVEPESSSKSSLPDVPPIPKPRKRRESLKDQILKLTGRSTAARVMDSENAPLSPMSPSTSISFPIQESIQEEVSSRVESPTPSQGSKKTSISAEMKSALRGKIREQAQSLVDRTRGAAALSKRLQRRTTLAMPSTTPAEINNDDEAIEEAIRKGEEVTRPQEQSDSHLSEQMQMQFMTQVIGEEKEEKEEETRPATVFHSAIASPPIDSSLLKWPPRQESTEDVESAGFFFTRPKWIPRWNREGDDSGWSVQKEQYKGLPYDNDLLVASVGPEWSLRSSGIMDELDVHLGRIVFNHHWAFSLEDEAAASLRESYEKQAEAALNVVEAVKEGVEDNTEQSYSRALEAHALFIHLGKEVTMGVNRLIHVRREQGYASNTLEYIHGHDDRKPLSISSLGRLSSVVRQEKDIPEGEKKRMTMASKLKFRLVVHFNGILALRTPFRTMADCGASFKQIYTLRVHSPPTSLTVSIVERMKGKERTLAVVGVALPSESTSVQFASDNFFNPLEGSLGADSFRVLRGYLECGVKWKGGVNEVTNEEDDVTSGPFSLFIPECELDDSVLDDVVMGKIEDSIIKDEPLSPIGIILGLERERINSKNSAFSLRRSLLDNVNHRKITLEDVVREEPIPSLAIAFGSLFGPADVSRKLKPMRKDPLRTQAPPTAAYRLIINVQSARRLSARSDSTQLRPFVSITTSKGVNRTPTANGINANWQHTVVIEMDGERMDMGYIRLEVFDEVIRALPQDDRLSNTRYEESIHALLGYTEIAPSSIVARSKLDSFLFLKSPLFSSDYVIDSKVPSYLKILIAVEPATIIPSHPPINRGSAETNEILAQCASWTSNCSSLFTDRNFVATVVNSEGKTLVASRFLRPLPPPPSVDSLRSSPPDFCSSAARAVSLIPLLPDDPSLTVIPHLWCTADQLLTLEYGTVEEHGVLLACWCLTLDVPVYLLLGRGSPEGDSTALVLVQFPNTSFLLNPMEGTVLSLDEEASPLWVHTVVSSSNVYANLQNLSHSSQIHYDFTKKDGWRSLFDKDPGLPSMQPEGLQYIMMKDEEVVELKSALEREMKVRVDESRQYGIPQWNLLAARYFREALHPSPTSSALTDALSRLQSSFTVSLFVTRSPFISISSSVENLLASRVHLIAHPQAQFALSVGVENVFNSVVAVTLALAVLIPKE